jgi:hypothetical protein
MRKIGMLAAAALVGGVVLFGALAAGGAVFASSPSGSGDAAGTSGARTQAANRPRLLAGAYHGDGTWLLVDGTTRTTSSDFGSITAVDQDSITIERPDGQSVTAPVSDATCIRKEGEPAALADLAVGGRALILQSNGTTLAIKSGRPVGARQRRGCGLQRMAAHGDVTFEYMDGSTRTFAYDAGRITSIADGKISLTRRDGRSITLTYEDSTFVVEEGKPGSVADLAAGDGAMFFSERGKALVIRCVVPAPAGASA